MNELRETIARAVCDAVCENDGTGYPLMRWATDRAVWEAAADAVLQAIAKDAVVIERDDAMHIYDVLMSTGKTKTARLVFDAMTPKP